MPQRDDQGAGYPLLLGPCSTRARSPAATSRRSASPARWPWSPKLLFVSEPTRGIDIGAKKLVLETLVRLNREKGMTVVMVSS